jgi:predicted pyridoxine 5'-phosphate oxidase superfamily flavin-nucleotide-binding protein
MNIDAKIRDAFEEAPLCYLGTCWNGDTNVVPVGFKWLDGDHLLIADLFFGRSRDYLVKNQRVAVTVGFLNPKRGFQIKATARIHREGPVFDRVCALLKAMDVDASPWAAIEIPFEEIYLLDPGSDAGKRIV